MRTLLSIGAAAMLLLGTACQTTPESAPAAPAVPAAPVGGPPGDLPPIAPPTATDTDFARGKALLRAGRHQDAMKHFAYLRDHAATTGDRDRAQIGLSMALQDSGRRGAALGALEPLPLTPQTGIEARKCIMAGELHLQQKNHGNARDWLIRGLEAEPGNQSPYRATALFNLGKILVSQDNLDDARVAFAEAQDIFSATGDSFTADQCATILADIDQALL